MILRDDPRHFLYLVGAALSLFINASRPAVAQITTVITPDGSLNTMVSENGPVHTITGGAIRGPNLFHSFEQFDVGASHTARFTGPVSIEHILSRVTGGNPSMVDGTLQSEIPGAHLFLLNPSGVVLGPNASLDIDGAFHVSTADMIRLGDGGQFVVDLSAQSGLSVANPVSFGFLSESPSGIRIDESVLVVPAGEMLSVVGGDIDIVGGAEGIMIARGGEIRLASATSRGDVVLGATESILGTGQEMAATDGAITLSDFAVLDVRGNIGGLIKIDGGQIRLEGGSVLIADTQGAGPGTPGGVRPGGVLIDATDSLTLLEGSEIGSNTFGSRASGDIVITAGNLIVRDGSFISSDTASPGQNGDVTIRVRDMLTIIGSSPVNGTPSGIFAQAMASSGSSGDILIEAGGVTLADGGTINGSTFGAGDGSRVTLRVNDTLTITGGNAVVGAPSGIFALTQVASGSAGDILIEAGRFTLADGGTVSSSTFGIGDGGDVTVRVSDTLTIAGRDRVTGEFSSIGSQSRASFSGAAGHVLIEAGTLTLSDGGGITSSTFGTGAGGGLTVQVRDTLTVDGGLITAQQGSRLSGAAGDVLVDAGEGILVNGGQIAASTFGTGAGGDVTVRVTDTLTINGTDQQRNMPSGVFVQVDSGASGSSGDLVVEARGLAITDGGVISGNTAGSGEGGRLILRVSDTMVISGNPEIGSLTGVFAQQVGGSSGASGDVFIEASALTLEGGGQIGVNTFGSGDGGDVVVRVGDTLMITGSSRVDGSPSGIGAQSGVSSSGSAGDVSVEARSLILTDGGTISSGTFGSGDGGQVTVQVSDTLTIKGRGVVDPSGINSQASSSSSGSSGDVLIETRELAIAGGGTISSGSFGSGDGGQMTVRVRETLTITGGDLVDGFASGIFSQQSGGASGVAGDVLIEARVLTLADGGAISSGTFGSGDGGDVTVRVLDTLMVTGSHAISGVASLITSSQQGREGLGKAGDVLIEANVVILSDGGQISGSTFGSGDGGNVSVRVTDALNITGSNPANPSSPSGIFAQANSGSSGLAGDVLIESSALILSGGGVISSLTFGSGDGGNVTIRTHDTVRITGSNPENRLLPSGIVAQAAPNASGSAGDVLIETSALTLLGGGVINSATLGTGDGGRVEVRVRETLTITGGDPVTGFSSGITVEQAGESSGTAGDVVVEARKLTLADGGQISGSTFGSGAGGSLTVRVRETLRITGRHPVSGISSSLVANSFGEGQGGNITICASDLELLNGSAIAANANDVGEAGDIMIDVTQTLMIDQSAIRTNALQADGGDVAITTNRLQLRDGQISTSVGDGEGRGGNIHVGARLGWLQRSQIRADAFGGPGGNVTIQTDGLVTDASSQVSASSVRSVDGTVAIEGLVDLAGSLTPIDERFASSAVLLSDRCAGRLQGKGVGQFTFGARDRIPIAPDRILPSPAMRMARTVQPGEKSGVWLSPVTSLMAMSWSELCQRSSARDRASSTPSSTWRSCRRRHRVPCL